MQFNAVKERLSAPDIKFTDVSGKDWFNDAVYRLAEKGIVRGFSDGSFKPAKDVYVDEFITMVCRALGAEVQPAPVGEYWAKPYIDYAKSIGLITDGEFKAYNKPINREQTARIAVRAAKKLAQGEPKTYPPVRLLRRI